MPTFEDFQRDYWAPDREAVLQQMQPAPPPYRPPRMPQIRPGPTDRYANFQQNYWAPDRDAVLQQMQAQLPPPLPLSRQYNVPPANIPPWARTPGGQSAFGMLQGAFPNMPDAEVWAHLNTARQPDQNYMNAIIGNIQRAQSPQPGMPPPNFPAWASTPMGRMRYDMLQGAFPNMPGAEVWSHLNYGQQPDARFMSAILNNLQRAQAPQPPLQPPPTMQPLGQMYRGMRQPRYRMY